MTYLTKREKALVALLAQGLSGRDLAAKLGCALMTVKVHKRNIYRKTGAHNSVQLLRYLKEELEISEKG